VREESLSQIKQVEVLTQDVVRLESELEYVRNVNKKEPLNTIPARIAKRYKENFNYLVNQVSNIFNSVRTSASVKDGLNSLFGFKKIFLMLTDVGKVIAISSTDGAVQWTEYLGGSAQKIIVRNLMDSEIEDNGKDTLTQELVAIFTDHISFLNPYTGSMMKSYTPSAQSGSREFIIITLHN
jgi:hypothetical protein